MIDPLIGVRAIHFASTVLVAGTIFFRFFVAEPAFRASGGKSPAIVAALRRRWTRIAWINLALAVVSGAAWLVLLAADIGGVSIIHAVTRGVVWIVTAETLFGLVWIVRLGLAVVIAGMLSAPAPKAKNNRRLWDCGLVIAAGGLLAALAWPGHSGATPGPYGVFYLAADALHLIAAGAWVGGLLPLALVLACARRATAPAWTIVAANVTRRFSTLGIVSVGTLLATGMANTWNLAGSVPALTGTDYGRLLLLKIALFLAMVCLAAVNRLRLTPRLADRRAMGRLRRNAVIETLLGLLVIAIVGGLGTLPPALHEQHASHWSSDATGDVAFVHIHMPTAMAEVTIAPGHPGPVTISIRILREDVTPLAAKQVTLILSPPAAGIAAISRPATMQSEGIWQVDGLTIPQPGTWNVVVEVLLSDSDKLVFPAPIVIEP